ncbi:phospholipase A2 inhibitor NAI-like [Engystomops pustulosus]|uniref:phospholipase A2 inhibitor NAI-like n=1 Tax=Engystomops pustulosus TaxID=76066 RepID=UPI003AFA4D2D
MKNLVFMTCVISALVVSVFSVKCYSCCSENNSTCKNVTVIDCIGDKCMTLSQNLFSGMNSVPAIFKGCAIDEMCENKARASGENLRYRLYASCCIEDLCNEDEYRLPADDPTPNGLECPTCYSINSTEECVSKKKINCTGNENQCFTYLGVIKDPGGSVLDYSLKGCANNFSCKVTATKHIGIIKLYGKGVSCYTPHPNPVTPKYTQES